MSTPRARARSPRPISNYLYSAGRPDDRRQEPLPPVQARAGADRRTCRSCPKIKLVSIDDPLFGGWAKAQPKHFGDGGIFDQIYKPAQ